MKKLRIEIGKKPVDAVQNTFGAADAVAGDPPIGLASENQPQSKNSAR